MATQIDLTSYTHYANNQYGASANLKDNSLTTYCQSMTYCAVNCTTSQSVSSIKIAVHNSTARGNLCSGSVKFQGSNNSTNGVDGTWTDLVTITSTNYGTPASYPGYGNEISISSPGYYTWYRISGLAQNTSTVINEWQFFTIHSKGSVSATLPILDCFMQTIGSTNDITIEFPILNVELVCLPPRLQIDLPIFDFYSESGRVGNIEFEIPIVEFSATGGHVYSNFNLELPCFETKFYTGARANIRLPILDFEATATVGRVANLDFELPVFDFKAWTAGKGLEITLPMLDLEIKGNTPIVGNMVFPLPTKEFLGYGFVGIQGEMEFEIPILETLFGSGANLDFSLPIFDCDGGFVADTPIVGELDLSLGVIKTVMVGSHLNPFVLDIELPTIQMYGMAETKYNELECELPNFKMTANAINNGLSNIDMELPMFKTLLDGYYHRVGGNYMEFDLPMFVMMSQYTDAVSASVLRHVRGQVR
jgi:hypothetical protein